MSDPLATYLEDHLAGASAAIDLLESLRDQHASEPLGPLAAQWLDAITDDRKTLLQLIDRVEHGPHVGKEAAAWLAEKVSRAKLGRVSKGDLGTFQALESISAEHPSGRIRGRFSVIPPPVMWASPLTRPRSMSGRTRFK